MARRNKIFKPNETYFITFTILGWKKIFINDEYCGLIYKWFDYIRKNYKNKIYGYVIMPNHVHALIRVTDKSSKLSVLIMNAKRFFAYEIVKLLTRDRKYGLLAFFRMRARTKEGAKHKLFEDRYDSLIIQSQKLFLEKLNYIHKNPCQENWQLVDEPEDYRYSSASNYTYKKSLYEVDIEDF